MTATLCFRAQSANSCGEARMICWLNSEPNAGADGLRLIRIGVPVDDDDAGYSSALSGANDGAEVAWGFDGFDGEVQVFRRADFVEPTPLLFEHRAKSLRLHSEG